MFRFSGNDREKEKEEERREGFVGLSNDHIPTVVCQKNNLAYYTS